MKALILAAGKGTRLGNLTTAYPKPMLPVGDRPLLGNLLAWLSDSGVREVAINLHHAPDAITSYVGDGAHLGVHVTYSYEETLLGTAGDVRTRDWRLMSGWRLSWISRSDMIGVLCWHSMEMS